MTAKVCVNAQRKGPGKVPKGAHEERTLAEAGVSTKVLM